MPLHNVIKLWVKALRSGEYKQGQNRLRTENAYCCLGVLCDLHSKDRKIEWYGSNYLNHSEYLPNEVMSWSGLDYSDEVKYNGQIIKNRELLRGILPNLNDSKEYDFDQIANVIEAAFLTKDE